MRKLLAFRNCWNGLGPKGSDLIGGVGYYRITKPCQYLAKSGKYSVFEFGDITATQKRMKALGKDWELDELVPNLIRDCDVLLMKNISHPGGLAWFAGAADYYNKPLVLDMDDNFEAVDDLHPQRTYFKETEIAHLTHTELYKVATAIIVAAEPLKSVYGKYNKNVHVIPNYCDPDDWKYTKGKRADGRIVIGWAGSLAHESDLRQYIPVMGRLWQRYGERIIFAFGGAWTDEMLKALPKESYITYSGTRAMRDYFQRLALWGFDIGVAPLKKSAFSEGKSYGKWLEYSMYKIPTVAMRWGPYPGVITDGATGFLVDTVDEWVERLSQLVESEQLRQEIGRAAYVEAVSKYQWKDHWQEWDAVLSKYKTFR